MNLQKISLILFAFFSTTNFAQGNFELGKVTLSELEERIYPNDTTTSAAILFQVGKTYFEFSQTKGFELVTETDTKIKIYTEEGLTYGKQNIEFYKGEYGSELVSISKAVTYSLIDEELVKTNLSVQDIPIENKSKHWSIKKMVFPNVKVGSIIEYRIVTRSPFISSFPEWGFQKGIPVKHSEYSTNIPPFFNYKVGYKGDIEPTVTVVKNHKTIVIDEREKTRPSSVFYTSTKSSGQNVVDYDETKTIYITEDVPAMEDEAFVNNINNYRAAVIHQLLSKKMLDGTVESFETDWATVAKKIYDSENFSGELNKTGYFEKDLNIYLRGVMTKEDKLKDIFNFVKKRMTWNGINSYSCDDDITLAYGGATTGNSAEINLMLTAMLRYSGFDANPVLISTRTNGIAGYPSLAAFDYVIVAVDFNGSRILLDATSKNALPGIIPINALNGVGRMVKKDGSSIEIDTKPKAKSKEIINLVAQLDTHGNITGKLTDQYFDYNAFSFREKNNGLSQDDWVQELEDEYEGIEIENYIFINSITLSLPIEESYSFVDSNSAELNEGRISFSPALFFAINKNPFVKETRKYPADFVYPQQDEYKILITIPDGYGIVSMPESKRIVMLNDSGSFNYTVSINANQVQLLMTLDLNQAVIESPNYYAFKNFYKEMTDKMNEKIILVKN